MNRSTADNAGATQKRHGRLAARVRSLVASLAFFAVGVALGAWWFSRVPSGPPAAPVSPGPVALSESGKSDPSRAIADVDASGSPAPTVAKADAAVLDAVKQAIPNLDSVSVEEGSRLLRAAALDRMKQASQEVQFRVKQAEDHFLQAQNSPSEAEQDAALKDLQQVRKEQALKLTEIALAARAQQVALEQLKGAGH
jgi:hypothetical protein